MRFLFFPIVILIGLVLACGTSGSENATSPGTTNANANGGWTKIENVNTTQPVAGVTPAASPINVATNTRVRSTPTPRILDPANTNRPGTTPMPSVPGQVLIRRRVQTPPANSTHAGNLQLINRKRPAPMGKRVPNSNKN